MPCMKQRMTWTRELKSKKKKMGKNGKQKGKTVATIPNVSLHFSGEMATGESCCILLQSALKHASECLCSASSSIPTNACTASHQSYCSPAAVCAVCDSLQNIRVSFSDSSRKKSAVLDLPEGLTTLCVSETGSAELADCFILLHLFLSPTLICCKLFSCSCSDWGARRCCFPFLKTTFSS